MQQFCEASNHSNVNCKRNGVHKLSHMKKGLSPCFAMENPQNKFYQKSKYMLHNYISYATIL